jgi:Pla-1/cef family extracellular lipase
MKKLVLSLPVAIAMGLSGCGGDDTTLNDITTRVETNNETIQPIGRVVFDPTGGKLSVPNDLLFSGTTDGTLEVPDEVAARAANGAADYSDPGQALGVLDGWSTQSPFSLGMEFPAGLALNPDSAAAPGAVRIFEVKMGQDPGCDSVPRGAACAPVAELSFGVDFVTSASGNSVVVAPLKPFKPAATYIVAMTNVLKDTANNSVGGSTTYGLVRQDIATHPLATPTQLALQGAINSFEAVLSTGFGVDKSSLIMTQAMTIQSVGETLGTIKTMMAANMSLNPAATPQVHVDYSGMTVAEKLVAMGIMEADNPTLPAFGAALLYEGSVNVPYYLSTPSADDPMAPVNNSWKAACDTAVMVSAYAAQVGDAYPYNPATTAPVSANDAMCMALSSGQLRDFTNPDTGFVLDKERHLTKFNKIPQIRSFQNIDVQMTVPEINTVNFIRVNQLGQDPISMPEAGWPVVMMQHGIPSRKEDMLAVTANLALAGFASVAIDLPLHNSRGFDLTGDGVDEINAYTVSPTHFINLGNLPVGRDNVRQGVADMMALRLGLNFTQGADIDVSRVYAMSLSLGAMTTNNFLAITNTPGLDAALSAPGLDNMFKVKASVLAAPGGGIASLLVDSTSFGPLIQGSVLSGAGGTTSDEFNALLANPPAACVPYLASQDAYVSCAIQVYLGGLVQAGETAKLAEVQGTIASFIFAGQTVLDSADPNNFAGMVAANGSPVLLTEMVGDGMENLSDQVVPNQSTSTPNGGTEPLIRALHLADKPITMSMQGEIVDGVPSTFSGVIRFTKGHHSSLINPSVNSAATEAEANARVTGELQSQGISYLATDGRAIVITDDAYILGAN